MKIELVNERLTGVVRFRRQVEWLAQRCEEEGLDGQDSIMSYLDEGILPARILEWTGFLNGLNSAAKRYYRALDRGKND